MIIKDTESVDIHTSTGPIRQDPHIPREGRALIYNALSDAGVYFHWHEFNAAHAFLRDEGPRYDPAEARICYDMVLELFTRTLNKE